MKWVLLAVVLMIAFTLIAFLYFATSTFPYEKPPRPAAVEVLLRSASVGEVEVQADHITYLLNELGAYQLHNPPLSRETPNIEVVLGDRVFGAEVVSGVVSTKEKALTDPDIRITTSEDVVIDAIRSQDVKNFLKKSVAEGKTKVEQLGSYSTLFSKGYLNLYNELTGKSMTGNIVKIFSEG